MKTPFYSLWPLILFIGTAIVGITGWIKSVIEIGILRRKLAELAQTQSSVIHVPKSTEEILRYGNSQLRGLMAVAVICAVVATASAAIVVPTVIRTVNENRELKKQIDEIVRT